MTDRYVRQISPIPEFGASPQLFSTYLEHPNIVLLGDPGAGKSHLFNHFSVSAGVDRLLARNFLNIPTNVLAEKKVLFIDALDEKRAGRGDNNTIDEVVRKLFAVSPEKVRISCRAADWLGETDLAAFKAYFDQAGGCVVLGLEPLSDAEGIDILREKGITNPQKFLDEAEIKGLEGFLTNPQSLIMLSEVVNNGDWPKSRLELFQKSVDILLSEHNSVHADRDSTSISITELKEAAGALCAVRLISDIDGFSLSNTNIDDTYPSHANITLCEKNKIQAVLNRRVFITEPTTETSDYTHRTIAEFLAASWLAEKVRSGLPSSRVRALIGIDGRPASELRGLHAWLAILLPECAATFIEADPFGVLSYGDVFSLTTNLRKHLLQELAKLAKIDPWFRSDNWSSYIAAGLSGQDMVDNFRTILKNKKADFTLRSIVLDAVSMGDPIADLQPEFINIISNGKAPYTERSASLKALLNLGEVGIGGICSIYSKIGISDNDLRLRAEIIRKLYGVHFGAPELVELMRAALKSNYEIVGGSFWYLHEVIPDQDIADILDRLEMIYRCSPASRKDKNSTEVLRVIEMLLVRSIKSNSPVTGDKLWEWLSLRHQLDDHHGRWADDELKNAISKNQSLLKNLADTIVQSIPVEKGWYFIHMIFEISLFQIRDELLVSRIIHTLDQQPTDKKAFLYEVAIALTFRLGTDALPTFEYLYKYADDNEEKLKSVRNDCCFSRIEDWRIEDNQRRLESAEKTKKRIEKNRSEFEKVKEQIRNGAHLGWLGWIAQIYFSRFSDLDREISPRERLVSELGEDNTQDAIDGLIALVLQGNLPTIQSIIQTHQENKYYNWWYAIIAGLDEYAETGAEYNSLTADNFCSALAIDCLRPTYEFEGNTSHQIEHPWKTYIYQNHPSWAADVYLALTKSSLTRNAPHIIDGLYELMHLDCLKPYSQKIAINLLQEFPMAPMDSLKDMLAVALNDTNNEKLLELTRNTLRNIQRNNNINSHNLWLATGLLISPQEFKPQIDILNTDDIHKIIWALRDLCGFRRLGNSEPHEIPVENVEYIVNLAAGYFPSTSHPLGSTMGDTNACDATNFIHNMISRLSGDTSAQATASLERLSKNTAVKSYKDYIKHSLAQQRIRKIDKQFQQPNWKSTISTLMNGAPANIADFHALVLTHLIDLGPEIATRNTDIYKRFWSEDKHGKIVSPKSEESCRDVLVDLLRPRLVHHGVTVDPEGHMAADKRADIVTILPNMKVVIELKRDNHAKVWKAIREQLDRFYTRDPDAQGYGIYGVFWYGEKRGRSTPRPPAPLTMPQSALEMQQQLQSLIPVEKAAKVQVIVIDVSEPKL